MAHQEDPAKALREAEAVARGALLRAESVAHARKHADRFAKLFPSREAYEAWLGKAPSNTTWAEGKLVQACSERLGAPIIVWSWSNERSAWERFTVAGKFSRGVAACAKNRRPISVILRDQHYAALKPPEKQDVPAAWLRECVGVVIDLLGAGKGRLVVSKEDDTPNSRVGEAHESLGLGEATPSLHSLEGSQNYESSDAARQALRLGDSTPSTVSLGRDSFRANRGASEAPRCVKKFSGASEPFGNLPKGSKGYGGAVSCDAAPEAAQAGMRTPEGFQADESSKAARDALRLGDRTPLLISLGKNSNRTSLRSRSRGEEVGDQTESLRPPFRVASNIEQLRECNSKIGTPVRNFSQQRATPSGSIPSTGEDFAIKSVSLRSPNAGAGNLGGIRDSGLEVGAPGLAALRQP